MEGALLRPDDDDEYMFVVVEVLAKRGYVGAVDRTCIRRIKWQTFATAVNPSIHQSLLNS
jgi:hypothetical protein